MKKYFESPNLNEARKREDLETIINKDSFIIEEDIKNIGINQTYHIRTYGCQANERDSETIAGILEMLGYKYSLNIEDADVILLNTCAVRDNAEQKVFGEIGFLKKIKRIKPNLIFGICGCMTQEENVVKEILKTHRHVDLVFGTHNIHRLPTLLKQAYLQQSTVVEVWSQQGEVIENLPVKRSARTSGFVNIMYGCDQFCTYCIVPYTRGKERSRLPEDIIEEVNSLLEEGFLEVTLIGQNVNSYGIDLNTGYHFGNLLEDVSKTNIPRIRFTTSNPWEFNDYTIEVIAKYDNIMNQIHLPMQSGSNAVLKKMRRGNTKEEYLTLVNKIKSAIPDVSLTTDIIVGFPQETEEEFQETIDIYKEVGFDLAFTFIYSQREGTPAVKLVDNVSDETKKNRLLTLNKVVNEYSHINNLKYENKVVSVLVEGVSKRRDDILSGYTEHRKLINFKGDKNLIGTIVDVKIKTVKTWSFDGELVG